MRILFLTTAHNSLSQRAQIELTERGHEVSVELALSDEVMLEAVALFRPDLILAPLLKRRIPEAIWRHHTCIVVHPGVAGDRGPSSLDWALHESRPVWGVTLLQAIETWDAGEVWATRSFETPRRTHSKSSIYRGPVTEAAIQCMLEVVARARGHKHSPFAGAEPKSPGVFRPLMKQSDRAIDWQTDTTAQIARKIRAADSQPGVLSVIDGAEYLLFGAHEEDRLRGEPGQIIATRAGAICRGTIDGAIWISQLKARGRAIKLPATRVLGERVAHVPSAQLAIDAPADHRSFRQIRYVEDGPVGYLHFDFYNGAMSTEQCQQLRAALLHARSRPTRVIALMGGADFFSNGIHLNVIEAAADPAEEAWRNIQAIDDLVLELLNATSQYLVAVVQGNAGAGGAMLALAADEVWARSGVVLNPHYRSMGGLYGSEYWTYTLPRRVGELQARELTRACQPLGTTRALQLGVVDAVLPNVRAAFLHQVRTRARELALEPSFSRRLHEKQLQRDRDESLQPLATYRARELTRMYGCLFAPDSEFHEARRRFVYKDPPSCTPMHLAQHRCASAEVVTERQTALVG